MNVTKFGAFVNVLPGRDGLLHISKLGRGKRVERVEDVLNLGDEVTVRVDDIDNSGKLSLSLAGDEAGSDKGEGDGGEWVGSDAPRERSARPERASEPADDVRGGDVEMASFDDAWDSKARVEFGDLGPADEGRSDRGGDRGGERRGGGGGGRRRGGRR